MSLPVNGSSLKSSVRKFKLSASKFLHISIDVRMYDIYKHIILFYINIIPISIV